MPKRPKQQDSATRAASDQSTGMIISTERISGIDACKFFKFLQACVPNADGTLPWMGKTVFGVSGIMSKEGWSVELTTYRMRNGDAVDLSQIATPKITSRSAGRKGNPNR